MKNSQQCPTPHVAMNCWCLAVELVIVVLFVEKAPVAGAHEIVTPVTFVCTRLEEGRETVFCRRTCQGLRVAIVPGNERGIKVRARRL